MNLFQVSGSNEMWFLIQLLLEMSVTSYYYTNEAPSDPGFCGDSLDLSIGSSAQSRGRPLISIGNGEGGSIA